MSFSYSVFMNLTGLGLIDPKCILLNENSIENGMIFVRHSY
jgi:hypothetical protein